MLLSAFQRQKEGLAKSIENKAGGREGYGWREQWLTGIVTLKNSLSL
jgi:hypothetical protein